jgi:hypothetical protein
MPLKTLVEGGLRQMSVPGSAVMVKVSEDEEEDMILKSGT